MKPQFNSFPNKQQLDQQFARQVADLLRAGIQLRGKASLAVSGGSTPKGFFKALSEQKLDWSNVQITLVDDRWLAADHDDSNQKLVKENLLVNEARVATFYPLSNEQGSPYGQETQIEQQIAGLSLPLDVAILGMGTDGHTASLFPCCAQLQDAMDTTSDKHIYATTPTTAPYDRVTFGFASLAASRALFLHISGDAKKAVYEQASAEPENINEMPIRAFMGLAKTPLNVMWAA